jgi:hypothetical protein
VRVRFNAQDLPDDLLQTYSLQDHSNIVLSLQFGPDYVNSNTAPSVRVSLDRAYILGSIQT